MDDWCIYGYISGVHILSYHYDLSPTNTLNNPINIHDVKKHITTLY